MKATYFSDVYFWMRNGAGAFNTIFEGFHGVSWFLVLKKVLAASATLTQATPRSPVPLGLINIGYKRIPDWRPYFKWLTIALQAFRPQSINIKIASIFQWHPNANIFQLWCEPWRNFIWMANKLLYWWISSFIWKFFIALEAYLIQDIWNQNFKKIKF